MNNIKKFFTSSAACGGLSLEAGLLPMLLGIAALGPAPALAVDECGAGPTVTCAAGAYASGITYNFSSDLSFTPSGNIGIGGATGGLRLTGSGDANLNLNVSRVWGVGGIQINLDTGNFTAELREHVADTNSTTNRNVGTGLHVSTGGVADLLLRGSRATGSASYRLNNLVMDVGSDSQVWVDYRRAVLAMDLSPRAGATLTVDNDAGIIGSDAADSVNTAVAIRGSGAGHLVISNLRPRSRINGNMDFTGMTGRLTLLNDYSGHARQGGWHTAGTNLFGSGDVEIRNGRFGVLRTASDTALDFSDTRDALFVNEGRVMVGINDIYMDPASLRRLTFIGVDRFENAGLILLGTDFDGSADKGDVTNGKSRERLVFMNSHYAGVDGVIAFDVLLGSTTQSDCVTITASDCVQFTGNSSTEGTTRLRVRDIDPLRTTAAFNDGIVMVEGASAAEHFVLDPSSQFYAPHTSGGAALQKGMVAYRLEYDASAKQHKLVGTLADEPVQAATLGAAAHETWRVSTDTWFDRQAVAREGDNGFAPRGLWATFNTTRGDRSLQRTVDIAGDPTAFNLSQDQDVSHIAFGLDLLEIRSGAQSWSGGVTVGMLYSTVDYEATQTQTKMSGMSGGIYGSWALSDLTVDAMFNLNYMRQSVDAAHFGMGLHNELRSQVKSSGGRIEAAWKLALGEGFWLQPLAGISLVNTSEGDLTLPDGSGGVRFGNDDRSIRVGGGVRLGADSTLGGLRAQYRLTGRMWNEREARNTIAVDVAVASEPVPIELSDDFSGNFNELDGSLSLSNDSGALSGYIGVKHKFADDYSSFGGSAGLRYSW